MEFGFEQIMALIERVGMAGIIFWIWVMDARRHDALLQKYQQDTRDFKTAYDNNVSLVQRTQEMSNQQIEIMREMVVKLQQVHDDINNSRWCPVQRGEKCRGGENV